MPINKRAVYPNIYTVDFQQITPISYGFILTFGYRSIFVSSSKTMNKIIIAIDSYKGCLSSIEAGEAAAKGIQRVVPPCAVEVLDIADGGEGIQDILIKNSKGVRIFIRAHDPLMNLHDTYYGLSEDGQTAFIEMASISGLTLVPPEKRNPMLTTSFGTGELIQDALEKGCRKFIIGIGGSATNDAGMGMLQALGFRFYNKEGKDIGKDSAICGGMLSDIHTIDSRLSHPALKESTFTVACDVQNPFSGPHGAAYTFAPQKGADAAMTALLDQNLQHLTHIIQTHTGKDISLIPGAGAAGGMGGALMAFFDATLKSGIDLLLERLHFSDLIKGANFILTGEGKSDKQTLMGKTPFGILKHAQKEGVPVILLSGSVEDATLLNEAGFAGVFSTTQGPISLQQAMEPSYAKTRIKESAEQIYRMYTLGGSPPP